MLRASWWLLGGWFVLVGVVAALLLSTDWWSPRTEGTRSVVVGSEAEQLLEVELERFRRQNPYTIGDLTDGGRPNAPGVSGDSLPIYDDAGEAFREELRRAATRCRRGLPYSGRAQRVGALPVDVQLEILEATTAPTIDTGYDWREREEAPEGTSYVQLLVRATNHGDQLAYPSMNISIMTSGGRLYPETFQTIADGLTVALRDEQVAGLVLYRLPISTIEQAELYAFTAGDAFLTSSAARAIREGTCVRLSPTPAQDVGSSDRIDDARLVG